MHFYQPSQREKLLESFAIDLDGIDGLLGEWQVSKEVGKTLTTIERYRERGLIKPKGRYWSTRGASFYYTPQEVERLKRELRKSPTGLERRRLSDEVVMSIYRDPRPQTKVAHDHGVGRRTVYLIKKGERYAYVTGHKTGAAK
jgi:hypothetical protein